MYKIRDNPFNDLKITQEKIFKIIEFRYLRFLYFYFSLHGFFLTLAILGMFVDYDNPSIWLIFWRLIWFTIKTVFPALMIFIPIYLLLNIPQIKMISILLYAKVLEIFFEYKSLRKLLIDIQKYNSNISNFIVTCATNNLYLSDTTVRDASASLAKSKNFIIKSLEAETILRNHPDYNPERFLTLIDFSETLKMDEKLSGYFDIFNKNAQIALSVEREMEMLINRRI